MRYAMVLLLFVMFTGCATDSVTAQAVQASEPCRLPNALPGEDIVPVCVTDEQINDETSARSVSWAWSNGYSGYSLDNAYHWVCVNSDRGGGNHYSVCHGNLCSDTGCVGIQCSFYWSNTADGFVITGLGSCQVAPGGYR